jgi:hypothetical protein
MHEFSLLLVGSRVRKENAVYLQTEDNGNRLSLHVWRWDLGHTHIIYWPQCWLLPYIRVVPVPRWPPARDQCGLVDVAFRRVIAGLEYQRLDEVIEGMITFYTWQVSQGAEPLANRNELCKVYTDQPYAVYLQHPCVPLPKLA